MGSLNEDEDGLPCPVCAERLLETLPGIFHAPWVEAGAAVQEEVHDQTASEPLESEEV